jgi:hypothetical protein
MKELRGEIVSLAADHQARLRRVQFCQAQLDRTDHFPMNPTLRMFPSSQTLSKGSRRLAIFSGVSANLTIG